MPTLFTRIIDGEIPGHFVWTDEHCVAFLSINPVTAGHALVVPRVEVDEWTDLPADLAGHLFVVAQKLGRAQLRAFSAPRIGLEIAGFEVPHCHLHVLPIRGEEDLHLSRSARSVENDELVANATYIRNALGELGLAP
jgi:diadenosine tetraphosphate (Ap4A) HIT family hydrolase